MLYRRAGASSKVGCSGYMCWSGGAGEPVRSAVSPSARDGNVRPSNSMSFFFFLPNILVHQPRQFAALPSYAAHDPFLRYMVVIAIRFLTDRTLVAWTPS